MFERKREATKDASARKFLPYKGHVNENVILCDNGEIFSVLKFEGRSFQTMDVGEINDWHNRINMAMRSIANERIAIQSYILRNIRNDYPQGQYDSRFAADLDQSYKKLISGKRLYANEIFLVVIERETVGKTDKLGDLIKSAFIKEDKSKRLDDRIDDLNSAMRDLSKLLSLASPKPLSTYERGGLQYSEIMELLNRVMGGRERPMPLINGHLSGVLATDRLIIGNEIIEIREPSGSRWAGILGVKEHAAQTFPGMLNGLLAADFESVISHSFGFLAKADAQEQARRKLGQMASTDDVAVSQAEELVGAMDSLQSNIFVLGEYAMGITVFDDDPKRLNDNISVARAIISEGGIVAAREDLALEAAYWAQLPANFPWRARPAFLNSRNFAALSPFHSFPLGKPTGNHWGDAVCLLKTSSRSPYYFNFHAADIGHTLIIGPTGSGKTVLQNFLLAQARKLGTRQFFIDKDRGAEIYVRAIGGTYLALQNGKPTGFAPLKALELNATNRDFLARWIRILVARPNETLSSQDESILDAALASMEKLPQQQRTLSALRTYLPATDIEGIGPRLERWVRGGEYGWVFDNPADELSLDAALAGFDMTDFLENEAIRPALMSYLFHRMDLVIDGSPTIIDIDEFWKALGDQAFTSFAKDGLKTYRKRNAMMLFGTQSPVDALASSISSTIVEQCATKILLPNPAARRDDYVTGLGLTETEYFLIKNELTPESRRFLVKQGHNSVVAELDLEGLDNELAVLSGRASTLELVTRLRGELGDDPKDWLPVFYEKRGNLR